MAETFSLSEIEMLPSDSITEEVADKYNGTKVKILSVTPGTKRTSWKDGAQLPQGQFVEVPVVYVRTDVFGQDAKGQPLSVEENFNVVKRNGKVGFSDHKKSKAKRFMKMLKINKIDEAIGREVVVVKKSFDSGRCALIMSIPD